MVESSLNGPFREDSSITHLLTGREGGKGEKKNSLIEWTHIILHKGLTLPLCPCTHLHVVAQ